MAKSDIDWAFSTVSITPVHVVGMEILHLSPWGNYPKTTTGRHSHDFWQFEVSLTHRLGFIAGARHELPPYTAVLIPPGMPHDFHYPFRESRWASVKFRTSKPAPPTAVIRPLADDLLHAFTSFHRWCRDEFPSPEKMRAIAHAFSALLEVYLPPATSDDPGDPFRGRLRALARGPEGQYLPVQSIARALGLSPNHLSAKFHQLTGSGLKAFLDRDRADHATRLLIYDSLPLGEVARLCGFEDLSTFSRFMWRVTGKRPGLIRSEGLETGAPGPGRQLPS